MGLYPAGYCHKAGAAYGGSRVRGQAQRRAAEGFSADAEQDDELKRNAIAALAAMGAKQPYYLYIMGHLVESRAELRINAANAAYRNALTMCLANMYEHCSEREAKAAVSLWDRYVGAQERLPRISRAQEVALAAAIEYTARTECGGKPSRADICNAYGVSMLRLDNAAEKTIANYGAGGKMIFQATCKLGVEALVATELRKLGIEPVTWTRLKFALKGNYLTMARACLWLRTAERVLLEVGRFEAHTFTDLFEG